MANCWRPSSAAKRATPIRRLEVMPVRKVPESQRREISRLSGARRPCARIGGWSPSDLTMFLSVFMPNWVSPISLNRILACDTLREDVHLSRNGVKSRGRGEGGYPRDPTPTRAKASAKHRRSRLDRRIVKKWGPKCVSTGPGERVKLFWGLKALRFRPLSEICHFFPKSCWRLGGWGSISPITDEGGGAAGDDDLRSRVSLVGWGWFWGLGREFRACWKRFDGRWVRRFFDNWI